MPLPFFTDKREFNYEPVYNTPIINRFFDNVYVLNLQRKTERLETIEKRLQFVDINCTIFNGVDGSVMRPIWNEFNKINSFFKNSSYLGCTLSHLSIYKDAISKNYQKILIVEDDCRIHRNIQNIFQDNVSQIPHDWNELLYLGYIPLSDDCSRWDYNVFSSNYISSNVFIAKNLWGLFSYGISNNMMKELLDVYDNKFPMELDRYFVNHVQPRNKSYGLSPQLFCAEDGYSDNSKIVETKMIERSVDTRFAQFIDYV